MPELHGFPYFEVEFDKEGRVAKDAQVDTLLAGLPRDTTDLFVIAHGWNNNMAEARQLYDAFFSWVAAALAERQVPGAESRRYSVLAILWPSKRFTDKELIPSGAAGAGEPVPDEYVQAQIDLLAELVDDPAAAADFAALRELVPDLADARTARDRFTKILLKYVPPPDEEGDRTPSVGSRDVLKELGTPVLPTESDAGSTAGAASLGAAATAAAREPGGGAAGLNIFGGVKAGAGKLLNLVTYYQMKKRAGVVGRGGVSEVLRRVRATLPDVKLHLVGHSFGGRVVAAAALGPDGVAPLAVDTVSLLQAAFSHFGFAQKYDQTNDGFFRRVVTEGRVRGPMLVTHSKKDWAVGYAYPLATRVGGFEAAGVGDKGDRYGGIGRNGAQSTPESENLTLDKPGAGAPYQFRAGRVYNLDGDACIGGHSDIARPEIAYALLSAVATT